MHKKEEDSFKTIGVFSYQGHTGVTHLALLLASYFSSKQGKKVWYFEVGNQYTIESILGVIKGRSIGKEGEFQVEKITFFPNISVQKGEQLVEKTPDIVIMDFGKITEEKIRLLKQCRHRWLVLDCAIWKQDFLRNIFSDKVKEEERLWTRCMCFLGKRHIKTLSFPSKAEIFVLPDMSNPFSLRREDLKQLLPLLR